jgi:hypothetical protein
MSGHPHVADLAVRVRRIRLTGAEALSMAKDHPTEISIGKFDILATYAFAKALLDGLPTG